MPHKILYVLIFLLACCGYGGNRGATAGAGKSATSRLRFCGEFIQTHATSSRWKLSRQLCEALGWKQANGALRDVVCRGLLLMLARAGEIELPPVRRQVRGQCRTARPRPQAVLIDDCPLAMPLRALGPVEIQAGAAHRR